MSGPAAMLVRYIREGPPGMSQSGSTRPWKHFGNSPKYSDLSLGHGLRQCRQRRKAPSPRTEDHVIPIHRGNLQDADYVRIDVWFAGNEKSHAIASGRDAAYVRGMALSASTKRDRADLASELATYRVWKRSSVSLPTDSCRI